MLHKSPANFPCYPVSKREQGPSLSEGPPELHGGLNVVSPHPANVQVGLRRGPCRDRVLGFNSCSGGDVNTLG